MNKIKVLELFAGTKSFSKELDRKKYEVISLDLLAKFNPDIQIDILEWNYKSLKFNPDIIWASPPCTEYSHAKRTGIRNLELADKIVKRTLEIINYFKPKYWFMENPQTGLLKDRTFMKELNLPFVDVSYCKYGFDYRKQTRIWTNLKNWRGKICKKDCNNLIKTPKGFKHKGSVGNGRKCWTNKSYNLIEKYSMPPFLIQEIVTKWFEE